MKKLKTFWRNISAHQIIPFSGHVAFNSMLALFPFLFFTAILSDVFGAQSKARKALEMLLLNLPSEVSGVLSPVVHDVFMTRHPNLLTITVAISIFSASNGIEAFRDMLNQAYGTVDNRPFWLKRVQSFGLVILGAVAMVLVSLLIMAAPVWIKTFNRWFDISSHLQTRLLISRYGIATLVLALTIYAMNYFLPRHRQKFTFLWPGVLVTVIGVIVTAAIFSAYVEDLVVENSAYVGLGGLIVTLLFFFCVAFLIGFGAELNAIIADRPKPPPQ
ncbi:MAG: YihY/virulence factor BrkB family protein, partial [Alphaproteobacteria bacterium]|nr:YihY/virulence factor BrkB family protein [Alphaproteobacteria bacterium]